MADSTMQRLPSCCDMWNLICVEFRNKNMSYGRQRSVEQLKFNLFQIKTATLIKANSHFIGCTLHDDGKASFLFIIEISDSYEWLWRKMGSLNLFCVCTQLRILNTHQFPHHWQSTIMDATWTSQFAILQWNKKFWLSLNHQEAVQLEYKSFNINLINLFIYNEHRQQWQRQPKAHLFKKKRNNKKVEVKDSRYVWYIIIRKNKLKLNCSTQTTQFGVI